MPPDSCFAEIPDSRSTHKEPSSILCAITKEERRLFFPEMEILSIEKHRCEWVDCDTLSDQDWDDLVQSVRPQVMVTCWRTKRINVSAECERALKYICHVGGSVRRIVPRSLIEKGVIVSNWGDTVSAAVAEHALLLVLAALRDLPGWRAHMSVAKDERHAVLTATLKGKSIGIHGFGGIARQLIHLLKPFDARLAAYSHGVPAGFIASHGVHPSASLEDLMADCDVFIECEALTPLTTQSVTRRHLAHLRNDAVFVNVARGHIVEESALFSEAKSGRIRVALDVIQDEPISPDSRWLKLPGVLISPHIAGPTLDSYPSCGRIALENIRRFLEGGMPTNNVSLEIYDRST